jgi:hypothetical protein
MSGVLSANVCGSGNLSLTINFDGSPEDVNWEIRNSSNVILAWGGASSYASSYANQSIVESIPVLPDGDYALVIYDSAGNGLCCANGSGSYVLEGGGNTILAQGSIYNYSDIQTFCYNSTNNSIFDLSPPTPAVLTASNVTSSTVDLNWTQSIDNVGVLAYGVFYDGVYIGQTNLTSVTAPIPSGVTNIFVVARDEIGNFSSPSNIVTVMPTNGVTTTVFHQGYFETGFDGWVDGGADCLRYNGSNFSSEGFYSIRLRDNSGKRSSMTSEAFDLSGYDSVRVQFAYYHRGFETGEDFIIKLKENGSFVDVASFSKPNDFNANGFYSVNVLLDAADYDFNTNAKFRIQCDASENNDQIYVDQVILTGYTSATSNMQYQAQASDRFFANKAVKVLSEGNVERRSSPEIVNELLIYPNPANDMIVLDNFEVEKISKLQLYRLDGSLVGDRVLNENILSIGDLDSGIYLLRLELNTQEVITRKITKF